MEEGSTACLYCLLRTFLAFWSPVKEVGAQLPQPGLSGLSWDCGGLLSKRGLCFPQPGSQGPAYSSRSQNWKRGTQLLQPVQGKSGSAEFSCGRGGHSFPGLASHGDTILEVVAQLNLPGSLWEGQSWKSGHRTAMEGGDSCHGLAPQGMAALRDANCGRGCASSPSYPGETR